MNSGNGESNFDQLVGDTLNKLQFKINASIDEENAKTYGKVNVVYNNNDIFNVEYANKDKIYALRSNEIVTAFIGIENSNLKVLAQKLGIYVGDELEAVLESIKEGVSYDNNPGSKLNIGVKRCRFTYSHYD